MRILGVALIALGALLTFLSNPLAVKLLHVENPRSSTAVLVIKLIGLAIVIAGMLFVMEIL